jgi:serine/threonine protein kinase
MEWQKVVLKIGKDRKLLQDAETEENINRNIPWAVPLVLEKWEGLGPDGKPYYWILQEFIPGVRFQDYIETYPISDAHKKNIALQLWALHQIGPWEPFFWKILTPPEKRHADFPAYIGFFENCISNSPDFPEDRKERILRAIKLLTEKISLKVIKPCLIHGDFSDRNILIQDEINVRIIDFWDAKWSIREGEFAVMMTLHGALKDIELYREIIHTYEEMWWALDEDLFDLCNLCYGAFKTVRRLLRKSPDPGVWDKIIEPILQKIETEYQ